MRTIPKIFTRDFPLIMCQVWGKRYVHIYGSDVKAFPRNIFVFKDGLVETYRGPDANPEINGIILANIAKDPDFIHRFIIENEGKMRELEAHCARGTFTREQFLDFLRLLYECWEVIYLGMYIPGDERFTTTDREYAMEFRKKNDRFEYESFAMVGMGLSQLYPDLGPLARQLSMQELTENKIPSREVLTARMREKLFVVDDVLYDEAAFTELEKQYDFVLEKGSEVAGVMEFKGQVACPGNVQGIVQILMRQEDVGSFEEGRVLVSSMTVPTFLPAMQKAVAFVTDEGGITCHAAIVAREMKKPCVIGTRVATQVLKNGDMVEIDADNGIVRKL